MSDLGDFLDDFKNKLSTGSPSDRCVLCGTTIALLHPVDNAWACSNCHTPIKDKPSQDEKRPQLHGMVRFDIDGLAGHLDACLDSLGHTNVSSKEWLMDYVTSEDQDNDSSIESPGQ